MNSWTRKSFIEQLKSLQLSPDLKSNLNIFKVNTQRIPKTQNVSFLIKLIQKEVKEQFFTCNIFTNTVY